MKYAFALALAAGAYADDAPRLFYSKSFPGSTPAYVEMTLEKTGEVVYKEAPDDQQPVKFKLTPEDTEEYFALAAKLDRFARPLESGLNVAKMGEKTFRWIGGADKSEQKFNYSTDLDAQKLLDQFERITETEQHLFALERTVRFDKLGVMKALLQLESSWDRRRLIAVEQFKPLLERIHKNASFLNMARDRAEYLLTAFEAGYKKAE